jgi:alpha-tubulin suppressor-like RCC1 family protein
MKLYVGAFRSVVLVFLIFSSGCGLELINTSQVSLTSAGITPTLFSISGISGGTDLTLDNRLFDGLIPTVIWIDSADETGYEVSLLNASGTSIICGPAPLPADSTAYTFSSGCSLTNGTVYQAQVRAIWSDGSLKNVRSAPLFQFRTGPFVSLSSATTQEWGIGGVTATLSQAAAVPITVYYTTSDQTALAGEDYVSLTNASVTFAPGETSKSLPVPILADRYPQADHALVVDLSSASSASLDTTTASTLTIQDNDLAANTTVWSQIESGYSHTCAVVSATGAAQCWGDNQAGTLGDNSTTKRLFPTAVVGLASGVARIEAGGSTSCALLISGGVKCWGGNFSGAVGDNSSTTRLAPVDVTGLTSGVSVLSGGRSHNCVVRSTGEARCWGDNSFGQLGDNSTTLRRTSVAVSGLGSGVTSIAAGDYHSCALLSTGAVKCWGSNSFGQVGDNTATVQRNTPVDVFGLSSGVTAIVTGEYHSCALLSGGTVKCWGSNSAGGLGDGTTTSRNAPVDVVGLPSGVVSIHAGSQKTCAILNTGAVRCWGGNYSGEVGDGTVVNRSMPTLPVGLTSDVSSVSVGNRHVCASLSSGGARCWGDNGYGQLGDGSESVRTLPADIVSLGNQVNSVSIGAVQVCTTLSTGSVKCWGENDYGALGDGTEVRTASPVEALGVTEAISVVGGHYYTCALNSSGGVKCWGSNAFGRLGDASGVDQLTAVDVSGLTSGVTSISAGWGQTCALLSSGGLKCWGVNWQGQLGDNSTTDRDTPVDVFGLTSGVTAVSAGPFHTCAVLSSGAAKCWGEGYDGRNGDGTTNSSSSPQDVVGLSSGVIAVGAGDHHSCAVLNTGVVKCWGSNSSGQLGNGTTTASLVPVDVVGLTGARSVYAGWNHTCALLTSGAVKCWGSNHAGSIGDGTTTQRLTPTQVSGLTSGVTSLSVRGSGTCARIFNGSLKCWGSAASNEMYNTLIPQPVRTP